MSVFYTHDKMNYDNVSVCLTSITLTKACQNVLMMPEAIIQGKLESMALGTVINCDKL